MAEMEDICVGHCECLDRLLKSLRSKEKDDIILGDWDWLWSLEPEEMEDIIAGPSSMGSVKKEDIVGHWSQEARNNPALLGNFEEGKCQLCTCDLKIGDGVMLDQCLHLFCRPCLRFEIRIVQKNFAKVSCPLVDWVKCSGFLNDREVKELVTPEVYQEYIDRSIVIARRNMRNVFVCKNGNCGGWCEYEQGRKTFHCQLCGEINCLDCNAIHSGVNCEEYRGLLRSGQQSKLKELIEKERNSGWYQLKGSFKSAENAESRGVLDVMTKKNLLMNIKKFDCSICYTEVAEGSGVILPDCLHMFCKACLVSHVEQNHAARIKCPYIDGNYSCESYLPEREIRMLVPLPVYEKHLQRSMNQGESVTINSFHCKTPDCPGWCEFDEGATQFDCPVCKQPNCIPCDAIHTDSCWDYKVRTNPDDSNALSERFLQDLIEQRRCARCPHCTIPIQKIEGCSRITCSYCRKGSNFDYLHPTN